MLGLRVDRRETIVVETGFRLSLHVTCRRVIASLSSDDWKLVLYLLCVDVDALTRFALLHPEMWNRCMADIAASKELGIRH